MVSAPLKTLTFSLEATISSQIYIKFSVLPMIYFTLSTSIIRLKTVG